ncbi:MAG TPA: FtsX-like permease family protein, partial [Nevskiaceae bacterium]|nr:FtsX-like permease family protein [Nevskiaceae bacterium]
MRSKVALILIGLQIALTLAIVCNALFIIRQRMDTMGRPSGMDEANTFTVASFGFGDSFNTKNAFTEDLALLRGLPGVKDVSPMNTVPMSQSGWSEGVSLKADQKTATTSTAIYFVDEHGLDAYGLRLVAGRNFKPEEITVRDARSSDWPPVLMVTRALAEKLFPGEDAVGKQINISGDPSKPMQTIIGVIDALQVPWPESFIVNGDHNAPSYSTLVPQMTPYGTRTAYLVRTEPGRRDELMKTVEQKLTDSNHSRIVRNIKSIEAIRAECYREDRAMMIILLTVIVCLLTITALGIVGMASFWVTQRTKQIGTRRALGATRGAILRYFLTENFLITSGGLALGALLTYGLSFWLMAHQQEAKLLPWHYVPVGFVSLWALGQLAVLGPATRASRVPPAVATRSV